MNTPATLILADGTVFRGTSCGADGQRCAEVVFNTAMTGYQEILTDPSYAGQLVTLTYPHIGNVGCNEEDREATAIHCAGLVIRDYPKRHSNWRSEQSLGEFLKANDIVAIADIDTRALTRHLRTHGAQNACLFTGDELTVEQAQQLAQAAPNLAGSDLAQHVSTTEAYAWNSGQWQLGQGHSAAAAAKYKVVAYDFGVKHNILRILADLGCDLTVVPAKTSAAEVLAMQPDGVFLSNGPGDPEPCDYAIEAIKQLLAEDMPIFGICLGHQLLALACGASTEKMKFGHHGANHPVQDLATGRVFITSQNHGFTVNDALSEQLQATHRSLFDDTVQGFRVKDKPAYGFQGHPEASPGPHDIQPLFEHFIELMRAKQETSNA